MPITLIEQFPKEKRIPQDSSRQLQISELFGDTIQGEITPFPATFLRLKNCTLACTWCDTLAVWKAGNPYSINELLQIFEENGFIERFREGQHLILTGGSPLMQQDALVDFIHLFIIKHGFKPFIEVENEAVLIPSQAFIKLVDVWNNSPKLENSGMKLRARYKPEAIASVAQLPNSFFKFVVDNDNDWNEIKISYLDCSLIRKDQIVLMPQGQTREELQVSYEATVNMCVKHNIRFSDRTHVTIWNKQTGV